MSEYKRQHWAAAIDQLFNVIKANLIPFVILFVVGTRRSDSMVFWYVLLAGLGFSFITGILSWFLFRYRVFEDELQIKKGIVIRKNLYLSKDRIQVIDVTEGIVQRLFGLVKVEIKTAGGGTEGATIRAITKSEANVLREELRKTKTIEKGEEETKTEVAEEQVLDRWKITNKNLVKAAFTSGNFGLIASILGAVFGQMESFINEENIQYLIDSLPGLNNVTLIISGVFLVIVLSWGLSFLGVIFNYSDFSISKSEKELLITSGLIEKKHITVPFNRIQAIRFVEGVFRQPFRSGMLYVESAGFEQNQKGRSIVLVPYISKDEVPGFFDRFIPELQTVSFEVKPPQRAFLRYLKRPNYLLLVLLPIGWFFWDLGWLLVFSVVPLLYIGWLRFRDAGVTVREDFISLRFRNLARTTAFLLKKRVQVVDETVNPFQAHKKLASFKVTAASGSAGIQFEIDDLDDLDASKLRSQILRK